MALVTGETGHQSSRGKPISRSGPGLGFVLGWQQTTALEPAGASCAEDSAGATPVHSSGTDNTRRPAGGYTHVHSGEFPSVQ